jgi:hypothetical protein
LCRAESASGGPRRWEVWYCVPLATVRFGSEVGRFGRPVPVGALPLCVCPVGTDLLEEAYPLLVLFTMLDRGSLDRLPLKTMNDNKEFVSLHW